MLPEQPVSGTSPSYHFILASTSPRRREFLHILRLPFTVMTPSSATEMDETPLPNEPPAELVQRLSQTKALAVVNNLSPPFPLTNQNGSHIFAVIAADTVVVSRGKILGKPATSTEATQMLNMLRQDPHYVYTVLTAVRVEIQNQEAKIQNQVTRLHQSKVWMRPYSDSEITTYVASGSPLDKAGAYGIQDQSFAPVERLEGCFASVMGLPLGELTTALEAIDILPPEINRVCTQHIGTQCCQTPI